MEESSGKRKRGETERERPAEQTVTTTDEEVEEFFAILKRMHEAAKHINGNPAAKRWTPAFQADDFDGDKDKAVPPENLNLGLDLNSAPPACSDDNDDLIV